MLDSNWSNNAIPDNHFKNPAKAIRAFCLSCVNGNPNEVKLCPSDHCPLYLWRFGKRPDVLKAPATEEEIARRAAAGERLKAMREERINAAQ